MERHELDILNDLVTYAEIHKDGGLTFEETEIIKIVRAWKTDGVSIRPVCPHCGAVAPYGDGRSLWVQVHLKSQFHQFGWRVRRRLRIP